MTPFTKKCLDVYKRQDKIETHYILNTGGKMLALAGLGMAASVLVGLLASRVGASVGRGLRSCLLYTSRCV